MLSKKCMSVDCGVFIDELLLIFSLNVSLPDILSCFLSLVILLFCCGSHRIVIVIGIGNYNSTWNRGYLFHNDGL